MASSSQKNFDFKRDGKDLRLSISSADVTVLRLSTAFEVKEETLYLKEEWDDRTVWPCENGRFNFSNFRDGAAFFIMGSNKESENIQGKCLSYAYANPISSTSGLSSKVTRPFTKKSSAVGVPIKIVLAESKRTPKGVQFEEKTQTYIKVTEETANVSFIKEKMKEKVGEEVNLMSANGLTVDEEEGTSGLKFWKCPSRKIFAVPIYSGERKRRKNNSDADSESEEEVPKKKSTQLSRMSISIKGLKEDLMAIRYDLSNCIEMVKDLTTVNKTMPLPVSVVKLVKDGFKCKICLSVPMAPPIVAARCCNTILGCTPCLNDWFSGGEALDKTCPNCREPRGYAQTYQLKGLDEFLLGFKKVLSDD